MPNPARIGDTGTKIIYKNGQFFHKMDFETHSIAFNNLLVLLTLLYSLEYEVDREIMLLI
jgi:hypothetical protein